MNWEHSRPGCYSARPRAESERARHTKRFGDFRREKWVARTQPTASGTGALPSSCRPQSRGSTIFHCIVPVETRVKLLGSPSRTLFNLRMFSHVVLFWTKPEIPHAADELLVGIEKFLKPIPGVLHFHAGKMAGSNRAVVDQTYQLGLNLVFPSKQAQDDYQIHPQHVEFVEKVFKKVCQKVVVYDFE